MESELTSTKTLTNTNSFSKLIFLKPRETNVSIGMANQINLTKGENRNSGISLPKAVMTRIDAVKHPDIPRSKFVLRILETALTQQQEQNSMGVAPTLSHLAPLQEPSSKE